MDIAALAAGYTQAWNSGRPEAVAGFCAGGGSISINGGPLWQGRAGVAEMAAGFLADIPDMLLRCDGVRAAGMTAIYLWTFTGTHAASGRPVSGSRRSARAAATEAGAGLGIGIWFSQLGFCRF